MDLTLGPHPDEEPGPFTTLHRVFIEHRERFVSGDWAVEYFEHGHDPRDDEVATDDVCPVPGCKLC